MGTMKIGVWLGWCNWRSSTDICTFVILNARWQDIWILRFWTLFIARHKVDVALKIVILKNIGTLGVLERLPICQILLIAGSQNVIKCSTSCTLGKVCMVIHDLTKLLLNLRLITALWRTC